MGIQENCTAAFKDQTIYFSFPTYGLTLCYYTVTGDWHTLPYDCSSIASIAANPGTWSVFTGVAGVQGEITAIRSGSVPPILDNWMLVENDLGVPITGTWKSPLTSSGNPTAEKQYEYIYFLIPYLAQDGVTVQNGTISGNLTIDPGSPTPKVFPFSFNVGATNTNPQVQPRYVVRLGPDFKGFHAQLTFSATNLTQVLNPFTEVPFIIYSAGVLGSIDDRNLVIPT